MPDVVDTATRSRMMAGIKGQNTRPEIELRQCLHRAGFRFRLHVRELPGRPDIVLPRYRAIIMVNGCFWHRHAGCRYATTPATRVEFWQAKFADTVERDRRNVARLDDLGWRVATVWECQLKHRRLPDTCEALKAWIASEGRCFELEMDDSETWKDRP